MPTVRVLSAVVLIVLPEIKDDPSDPYVNMARIVVPAVAEAAFIAKLESRST